MQEREYLAAVKHPNIVGIYDFVTQGTEGFIVMESVNGKTLMQLRKEANGPLPVAEAISYRVLDRTAVIPGIFDRRLRERLPTLPVRLCCVGWDASHWPDIGLLHVAAEKVVAFEMYVPAPRLPADGLQREWIEAASATFAPAR